MLNNNTFCNKLYPSKAMSTNHKIFVHAHACNLFAHFYIVSMQLCKNNCGQFMFSECSPPGLV